MKQFFRASIAILAFVVVYFILAPAFAGKLAIPTQINLGAFAIRLYGITIALSVLVGYLVARKYSWRFGISPAAIDDLTFWITIVSLLGARIYYVIFDWSLYSSDISEVYKIWHGGLSIYGAIIAGVVFILLYAAKKAYSTFQLLDLAALSMPLGQALGRFGNFFNQEAFGRPTNLPWKMYVDAINRPMQFRNVSFFHPTFLYEALISIGIYIILSKALLGKVRPGVLAFAYLGLYSLGRFFVEGLRLDSSYIHGIRVDQITAVIGVLVSGIMLIYLYQKGMPAGIEKSPKN